MTKEEKTDLLDEAKRFLIAAEIMRNPDGPLAQEIRKLPCKPYKGTFMGYPIEIEGTGETNES